MHVIIISVPAPNAYINLWTSMIKYSTLNAKCNCHDGGNRACFKFYCEGDSIWWVIWPPTLPCRSSKQRGMTNTMWKPSLHRRPNRLLYHAKLVRSVERNRSSEVDETREGDGMSSSIVIPCSHSSLQIQFRIIWTGSEQTTHGYQRSERVFRC